MKGAGMDDRFDAIISKDALRNYYIGHRTDDVRVGSGGDVEADHDMTSRPESRREKSAEPARRASEKNAHHTSRADGRWKSFHLGKVQPRPPG
jgi:hypothetical protein